MERENPRKDMIKGKAKLTFDPRAKDVVTNNVTLVDNLGILPEIAGKTNRLEQLAMCSSRQKRFHLINLVSKDHQVLLQVLASLM